MTTGYTPLTPEQYQSARNAGFSPDQIIQNEQTRKSQTQPSQGIFSKLASATKYLNPLEDITAVAKSPVGRLVGDVSGVSGIVKNTKDYLTDPNDSFSSQLGHVGKIAGSAAKTGITLGTLGAGTAPSLAADIGINAGIGGSYSAAQSLEQGKKPTLSGVLGNAALGGAFPIAGKGAGVIKKFITEALPKGLINSYLPSATDLSEHVLENTKLGSTRTMLENSKNNVKDLSNNINNILDTKYAMHPGNGNAAIKDTLSQFPNSEYTDQTILNTAKKLVPDQAKLVDKLANGTATLKEKNVLRSALDQQVQSVYTKLSVPPARKEIGSALAGSLRHEVQSTATETKPIFDELSKEINVRNALGKSTKRFGKVSLKDMLSAMTGLSSGFATGGPWGALVGGAGALGGERALSSPAVGIGAAKGLSSLGRFAVPQVAKQAAKIGIFNQVSKHFQPSE